MQRWKYVCARNQKWHFHSVFSIVIFQCGHDPRTSALRTYLVSLCSSFSSFKPQVLALAAQAHFMTFGILHLDLKGRISLGSGVTLLCFFKWRGEWGCPQDGLMASVTWEERVMRRDPGQPLAQPDSIDLIIWFIPSTISIFQYLWYGLEDSILSVTHSILGKMGQRLSIFVVGEPLGVWLVSPWEGGWLVCWNWHSSWRDERLCKPSWLGIMRTWKTRQLPKIKIKAKCWSEARNAAWGRITQIDYWTSSVGTVQRCSTCKSNVVPLRRPETTNT